MQKCLKIKSEFSIILPVGNTNVTFPESAELRVMSLKSVNTISNEDKIK